MPQSQIHPGLALGWNEGAAGETLPAGNGIPSVRFVFVLAGHSLRANDRMHLLRDRAKVTLAQITSGCDFHATVELSNTGLENLLLDERTPGAGQVRAFAASPADTALALPLSAAARLAVESIRRCPFFGAFRVLALTARCHDLIIEFLTALSAPQVPSPRPPPPREFEGQVRAAAAMLAQNLEEPPALAELARRAGLSETTLKRGFRQVFDTTAFGYLRSRRMECARTLLQSGEATVLEAAARVGYSNPSNFAAAFRRQFGLNPKAFQLTARR